MFLRQQPIVLSTLYQPMTHICIMSSDRPIRIYMGGLILGVNTLYWLFCFFKLFPMVGKRLMTMSYECLIRLLCQVVILRAPHRQGLKATTMSLAQLNRWLLRANPTNQPSFCAFGTQVSWEERIF